MKIINLNESQFTRLFDEGIENYGRSNTPEYQNQDEVTLTAKKINQDGDINHNSNSSHTAIFFDTLLM